MKNFRFAKTEMFYRREMGTCLLMMPIILRLLKAIARAKERHRKLLSLFFAIVMMILIFFPYVHINLMLIRAINTCAFATVMFDIKEIIQVTVIKMYFTIETRHELFPRSCLPLTIKFPD